MELGKNMIKVYWISWGMSTKNDYIWHVSAYTVYIYIYNLYDSFLLLLFVVVFNLCCNNLTQIQWHKSIQIYSESSVCQKSDMGLTKLKLMCRTMFLSRSSRAESISCLFQLLRGPPQSLAYGLLPSSKPATSHL